MGYRAGGGDRREDRGAEPAGRLRSSATAGSCRSPARVTTAVELGIPVVWVIFNNFCFSTIRTVGTTYFNNSYGTEFRTPDGEPYNPDFAAVRAGIRDRRRRGSRSRTICRRRSTRALAANVPYLLEVRTRGDVPMPRDRALGHRRVPGHRQRLTSAGVRPFS
mgnify:CR=1 FL=1